MSGLTEKLKDAIRPRSRHRQSKSLGENSNGRSSGEYATRKSTEAFDRETFHTNQPGTPTSMGGTVRSFQAMNIDDTDRALPPLPPDATQRIQEAAAGPSTTAPSTQSPVADAIPPRQSSMPRKPVGASRSPRGTPQNSPPQAQGEFTTPTRAIGHKTTRSLDVAPTDPSHLVPRKSPNRNSGIPSTSPISGEQGSGFTQGGLPTSTERDLPPATVTYATGTNITSTHIHRSSSRPITPPSTQQATRQEDPSSSTRPSSSPQSPTTYPPRSSSRKVALPSHVHVPPGMKLRNATETLVETAFSPSITREAVHHKTHEIVTPVITRDIHIDHYYHYVQPVKVLEILPARHFTLDPVTGQKIEIPAPDGWVAPAHIRPTAPGELDALAKLEPSERHYVVDETSPEGRVEAPAAVQSKHALRHKEDREELVPPQGETA